MLDGIAANNELEIELQSYERELPQHFKKGIAALKDYRLTLERDLDREQTAQRERLQSRAKSNCLLAQFAGYIGVVFLLYQNYVITIIGLGCVYWMCKVIFIGAYKPSDKEKEIESNIKKLEVKIEHIVKSLDSIAGAETDKSKFNSQHEIGYTPPC